MIRRAMQCLTMFCAIGPFAAEGSPAVAQAPAGRHWLPARAYCVPKETATEGEGYFSIIEGHNGRLYLGTHANGVNSWLVEFDPAAAAGPSQGMKIVVDAHRAIGIDLKGFGSQAKIHTRNNTGKLTGKIYFGTKQGYPDEKREKREDYPGGYPMAYDPAAGTTEVFPIPVPHHGINSIMPDESRGIAYVSTCSDHRPGPLENAVFLILDLKTKKYRELLDTNHFYGFIVIDHQGRAYHPILGGQIARYDPSTGMLEKLNQTIDGQPPTDASRVALEKPDPLNWDTSPDGKTLYCVPMSGNHLIAYDLTGEGNTLAGRTVGTLIPGAKGTDCRAMSVGPRGDVWCSITEHGAIEGIGNLHHLVRYHPGDKEPVDLGPVSIENPDFTQFKDASGKELPFHGGFGKLADGTTTTKYVTMGVCETKAGKVYAMVMHPYTVLEISPPKP